MKSDLHKFKFTWNSSGCNTTSESVTEDEAEKSQVPSAIKSPVSTFCITCLNFTFGITVIPPSSIVEALNNAADTYFELNSPA